MESTKTVKEAIKKALEFLVASESQSLKSFLCNNASVRGFCSIARELISAPVVDKLYIVIDLNDPVAIHEGNDKASLSTTDSPAGFSDTAFSISVGI